MKEHLDIPMFIERNGTLSMYGENFNDSQGFPKKISCEVNGPSLYEFYYKVIHDLTDDLRTDFKEARKLFIDFHNSCSS